MKEIDIVLKVTETQTLEQAVASELAKEDKDLEELLDERSRHNKKDS